ncbi:hypothetical protein LTV02_21760 [Nocardia yamanashiensis]|uniref:hypothetical protein n=1 Tax=Nocardia yamanashiensis TaxID=209247 RepID=UPI001E321E67|nr:hypothetical protein [Nocardia yamanashiensis]UGT38747.1 hypothetical protein LTV02_21760 [Nocardia yamanashiensis]
MARNTISATSQVETRLAALRGLADTDAQAAQDAAIGWLTRLTRDFGLPGTAAEIDELFALGTPPHPVGPSRGHVIGWGDWDGLDPAGRALFTFVKALCAAFGSSAFWLGKKYSPQGNSTNEWTPLFGNIARFVFPGVLKRTGGLYEGLDMITYVEGAYSAPGTNALILDFSAIASNPKLGRNIRDEVVQLVPGVHLARKTWNNGGGYTVIAHWYETVATTEGRR